MKHLVKIIIFATLISCQKSDDNRHVHFQLKILRNELVETINSQDKYIQTKIEGNEFFVKKYKTQKETLSSIKNTCKIAGQRNRKAILRKRDSINNVFNLNLNFAPSDSYADINDCTFEELVEIDFLRIAKTFQNDFMFPPADEM